MPTLIALNVCSASTPTASSELDRTNPPVMMTCRLLRAASSVAVVRAFVAIARSGRVARARATAAAVVPPLIATE